VVSALQFINLFASDIIVVWRACVIWSHSKIVIITSGLLLMASFVTFVIAIALYIVKGEATSRAHFAAYPLAAVVAFATSFATNVWSTVLVAIKTRQYWVAIRPTLQAPKRAYVAKTILFLLLESGAIYCFIWIFFLCTVFSWNGRLSPIAYYMFQVMTCIAGMYPVAISVLVSMKRSYRDDVFTDSVLARDTHVPMEITCPSVLGIETTSIVDTEERSEDNRALGPPASTLYNDPHSLAE